jgi:hypothetical protein
MWIKNTEGKKDAMLTFAALSFTAVTLNIFLATFGGFTIGGLSIEFQALDSSVMAVYLGATFTAYVSRRWTDKKYINDILPLEANKKSIDNEESKPLNRDMSP